MNILIEKLRNESINKERKNVQTKYFHKYRTSYYAETNNAID